MSSKTCLVWVAALILTSALQIQASLLDGTATTTNLRTGNCNISEAEMHFAIDEAFGEPLLTSSLNWKAGAKTSINCLPEKSLIWIELQTSTNDPYFIRFNPKIGASGTRGQETTASPNWNQLLCTTTGDNALCLSQDAAKKILEEKPKLRSLKIRSRTQLALLDQSSGSEEKPQSKVPNQFSRNFEQQLLEKIDSVLNQSTPEPSAPPVLPESVDSGTDALAQGNATPSESLLTKDVPKNIQDVAGHIANLMSKDLAFYTVRGDSCASEKSVFQMLTSTTVCGLSFSSKTSFDFLCADDQMPQPVITDHAIQFDLAADNLSKPLIRVSSEGWASLLLSKAETSTGLRAGQKTSAQFLLSSQNNKIEALSSLARQLIVLQDYCHTTRS